MKCHVVSKYIQVFLERQNKVIKKFLDGLNLLLPDITAVP